MTFTPATAYLLDYAHTGVAKRVKLYAKDAGGQGVIYYWVYIIWDDATTGDFGGGSLAIGSADSTLTLWKAGSEASDPTSGDLLNIEREDWIVMAVTDTRYGSWRCTVRKAKENE